MRPAYPASGQRQPELRAAADTSPWTVPLPERWELPEFWEGRMPAA